MGKSISDISVEPRETADPAVADGLRLMKAFILLTTEDDRKKVIALAEKLSLGLPPES
jgi:hypothetical protein